MANHDARSLVQGIAHHTVDGVPHSYARGIEIDIAHERFYGGLADATGIPVYGANDRLHPRPILRTLFSGVGPELFLHLRVGDARAGADVLGDFRLKVQKVSVDRAALGLNVSGQR